LRLPSIAGQNRTKAGSIADVKARYIEEFSFVGLLFKHSLLPDSIKNQVQQHGFVETVSSKIKACKSKGDFQKAIEVSASHLELQ
jgi:predicted carbohydrate-binding protein with CBM5 and CBM33 domain